MAEGKEIEKVPKCRICSHEERSGIEMLALMSCMSWNICRQRVNNTFGTNFSVKTIRTHLTEHPLTPAAMQQGIILDAIKGKENTQIISGETILQTLAVQGAMDVAKGKIRCKTTQELISVLTVLQNIQSRKENQFDLESGDISNFYRIMGAFGEAVKDTVSVSQAQEIIAKANALGAGANVLNMGLQHDIIEVEPVDYMQQAVDDFKTYGRTRTRDELIDAGVFDNLEEVIDLPGM